jgi:hypothetical protein
MNPYIYLALFLNAESSIHPSMDNERDPRPPSIKKLEAGIWNTRQGTTDSSRLLCSGIRLCLFVSHERQTGSILVFFLFRFQRKEKNGRLLEELVHQWNRSGQALVSPS